MWIIKLILISVLIAGISSAPGCLELCNQLGGSISQKSDLSTFESHSSNFKQHQENTLKDLHQSLTSQLANELHTSRLNIDTNRPGNWTDHKDYRTSDGRGLVHEEQGQLVNGQSQVRYYKKNYSSSYSSGQTGDNRSRFSTDLNSHVRDDQIADSSSLHTSRLSSDLNSQSNYRQSSFDNQQVVKTRGQSARLEDFGEQVETNNHHRVNDNTNENNWSRHNTYNADGGRGKIYEEEGQYHEGPVKVRYYKKNYTSSYSSGPIPADALKDLDLHDQLFQSRLHELSSVHDRDYNQHRVHLEHVNPSSQIREEYSNKEQHRMRAQEGYTPVQTVSYTPQSQIYSSESHQKIQQQSYVPGSQVVTETRFIESPRHTGNVVHVPLKRTNEYSLYDDGYNRHQQLTNPLAVEQTGVLIGDNLHQSRHNQFSERYINRPVGGHRVEEEHWSTSEHSSHTYPQPQTSINSALINSQQLENYNREDRPNSNRYASGGSYHQSYESHGSSSHGHHTADCDPPGHELRYNRRYRRDLSPSTQQTEDLHQQYEDLNQQNEDLHQQYEDLQNDFNQQGQNLNQQTEDLHQDFTQQTQNLHKELSGLDQHTLNAGRGDQQSLDYLRNQQNSQYGGSLNQQTQTTGYGQQQNQYNQGSYHQATDLNQQSQRGLDYHSQQQTNRYNYGGRHEIDQQSQVSGGLNRHLGSSNYDQQQNVGGISSQVSQSQIYRGQNHQVEDLSQQTEHLNHVYTQQQANNYNFDQQQSQIHQIHQAAELGQRTESINQHGFDDYTQQQSNNYNFGQQHVPRPGNQLHYGQQTQNHHTFNGYASETEDLNQQSTLSHGFQQDQGIQQQSGHFNQEQTEGMNLGSANLLRPAPKPVRRPQKYSETEMLADQAHINQQRILQQSSTNKFIENSQSGRVLSLEEQMQLQQQQSQESGVNWHQNHQLSDLTNENPQGRNSYPSTNPGMRTTTFPTTLDGNRDTWPARSSNPGDVVSANHAFNVDTIPETTPGYNQYDTTPKPGFWKKVGSKIVETYEKAKEKIGQAIKG